MANYSNLISTINNAIKTNGVGSITGQLLQTILDGMVASLGTGYRYLGIATPTTSLGTPDGNVFYLAMQAGTYDNGSGPVVSQGISVLKYNGSWSAELVYGVDDEPTNGSSNLVESGGVYDSENEFYRKIDGHDKTINVAYPTTEGASFNTFSTPFAVEISNGEKFSVEIVTTAINSDKNLAVYLIDSNGQDQTSLTLYPNTKVEHTATFDIKSIGIYVEGSKIISNDGLNLVINKNVQETSINEKTSDLDERVTINENSIVTIDGNVVANKFDADAKFNNINGFDITEEFTGITGTNKFVHIDNLEINSGSKFFFKATGIATDIRLKVIANATNGTTLINYYYGSQGSVEVTPNENIKAIYIQVVTIADNLSFTANVKNYGRLEAAEDNLEELTSSFNAEKFNSAVRDCNITGIDIIKEFSGVTGSDQFVSIDNLTIKSGQVILFSASGIDGDIRLKVIANARNGQTLIDYYYARENYVAVTLNVDVTSIYIQIVTTASNMSFSASIKCLENISWHPRKTKIMSSREDFYTDGVSTYSNGVFNIPAGSRIKLPCDNILECFVFKAEITVIQNGTFSIGKSNEYDLNYITDSRLCFDNGTLKAYAKYNGVELSDDFMDWIVGASGTMPIISDGTKIVVTIKKNTWDSDNKELYIEITDGTNTYSGYFKRYVFANSDGVPSNKECKDFVKMWGMPFISCTSGEISVGNISFSAFYAPISKLTFWGDSFIEGASLVGNTDTSSLPWLQNRYCALYAKEVGEEFVPIMGLGGLSISDSIVNALDVCDEWFRSQYIVLHIGTNCMGMGSSAFISILEKTYTRMKYKQQIPILITLVDRNDMGDNAQAYQAFRVAVNNYVRNCGERYIDISSALSDSPDGDYIPEYVLHDGVHPTVAGHKAIFDRMKMDVPEIFEV